MERESTLKLRNKVTGLGETEGACGNEENVCGVDDTIAGVHLCAFHNWKYIPLDSFP